MSKTRRSKTVSHAAKDLPLEVREPFIRAFKACKYLDIYDGSPGQYMTVIAQVVEDLRKENRGLKITLEKVREMTTSQGWEEE